MATTINFNDVALTTQVGVSVLSGTTNVGTGGAGTTLSLTITDNPVVSIQDTNEPYANACYGIVSLGSADGTVAISSPSASKINFDANGTAPGGGLPLDSYSINVPALAIPTAPATNFGLSTPALALWRPYPYKVPSVGGFGALYMDLTVAWTVSLASPPVDVSITVFQSAVAVPDDPYQIFNGVVPTISNPLSSVPVSGLINSMGAWTMPLGLYDLIAPPDATNITTLANPVGTETTTRTILQTISGACRTMVFGTMDPPNMWITIQPSFTGDGNTGSVVPTCSVVYNRFYSP